VTTSLIGLALSLALAAPAAAQGASAAGDRPLLGAGVSFLTDGDETGTGFAVDIAKAFRQMEKVKISGVGDFGYHGFDGFKTMSIMGGARVTATGIERFSPFGQFLIGVTRFSADDCDGEGCSESELTFAPGGGVDVAINEKFNFRGQIDFLIIKFEGNTENATRFTFGISVNLGG
jgi:opacity protein-like surface antigen